MAATNAERCKRYRDRRGSIGERMRARPIIAWDGEGHTIPRSGLSRDEYRAAVESYTDELLDADRAAGAAIWDAIDSCGGFIRILPGVQNDWHDLPRHIRSRSRGRAIDIVAQAAGCSVDDLVSFLIAHPRPQNRRSARAMAIERFGPYLEPHEAHRYVILNAAIGLPGEEPKDGPHLVAAEGIPTPTAIDFLFSVAQAYPKALHVMFGSGYDLTMILRDLPRHVAESIIRNESPNYVQFYAGGKKYGVRMRPRKWASFKRYEDGLTFTIWEVFGYYQTTFVGALRANGGHPDTITAIEQMKAQRSNFDLRTIDRQVGYCQSECRELVSLVSKLIANVDEAGLTSGRLGGPGELAAVAMKKHGVRRAIAAEPPEMARSLAQAYFGGRIETTGVGTVPEVFAYDIVSAYPAQTVELPNLAAGIWRSTSAIEPGDFGLAEVFWRYDRPAPFYPLPYRLGLDPQQRPKGGVWFPAEGSGWYFISEVLAAQEHAKAFGGDLTIGSAWVFDHNPADRPFHFVPDLFAQRKEWKRDGRGGEKILKLALNSIYGRTASQLGAKDGERPGLFSFLYAGAITAGTRAALLRAALLDPEAVLLFATDGLYTTRELPIETGSHLGAWEGDRYGTGVFVQPGVYWLRAGKSWVARSRGFDRASLLTPDAIGEAWEYGRTSVCIPTTRFITLRESIARNDPAAAGTWQTTPRELALDGGGKRSRILSTDGCERSFKRTAPRTWPMIPDWVESAPYESIVYDSHFDEAKEQAAL